MHELLVDDHEKPRILCVDDEEAVVTSLRRSLRRQGEILIATSAKQALDMLRKQPVDLIITDMRMPEMNGADLLLAVNQLGQDPARILLTGYTDMSLLELAINEGRLDRYISKPWDNDELISAVQQELHRKKLEHENLRLLSEVRNKNDELALLNGTLEEKVEQRTQALDMSKRQLEKMILDLKESQRSTARIFYNLLSLNKNLGGHESLLVGKLCSLIAKKIGVPNEMIGQIRMAGILGNLGLLCLDPELHNKQGYELTEEQRALYLTHPSLAVQAMAPATHMSETSLAIKYQFERVDGKGFPDKLSGKEIPIGARILSVARDYVDWMSGYHQKVRLSSYSAYKKMEPASGYIYDTDVMTALLDSIPKLNEELVSKDERILSTAKLEPGMVLSRDLLNGRALLLLTKERKLTASLIQKMQQIEEAEDSLLDVYVYK